ncbi:OmpA family protein [Mangrovibacterium diazotrophicum]|uniref:OOP family OmpA-OmpF porin n=1 Tax=Mangrovibacterium diazotrophicum TaxID=1261403 RepID=A0A419VYW7_9BACT|nr:OmpA family protein [Mangrovibacterium diazotrophicum]RKD88427.1 OOP family OmpA-OmpF porin [Mangrovibacterium diazotrophicum]
MKKKFLLIALIGFASVWAYGQDSSDFSAKFDKWSIDGGIGLTKPWQNFTPGYYAATPDFLVGEIGVRYMMSEYFGLKLDFGYNKFQEADESMAFETNSYRFGLQGVLNLGRMMNFETWTKTLGLLGHGGVGVGYLNYDRTNIDNDWVGNVLTGLTAQIRLSDGLALNLDGSAVANIRQNEGFDGGIGNTKDLGMVFNGTIGLSIYLGKNKTHADWYLRDDEKYKVLDSKIAGLDKRVTDLEDGKANKSDLDNTKGDVDAIAKDVDALKNVEPTSYDEFVKQLVNDGYINVYFDFNSTKVQGASANSVNFMKAYLAKNTGASVEVQGYADELGSDDYNQKLSQKRADAVVKLLTEAGIDGSRLSAVGKGEDTSVDKSSAQARQLARRVTFMVK